jgi:hypothetical protein
MAKITLRDDDPSERRYRFGHASNFKTEFYLVVSGYAPSNTPQSKAYPLATYRLYGVRTNGGKARLERVGKEGTFYYCDMTHSNAQRLQGARFITCNNAGILAEIERDTRIAALLEAQPGSTVETLIERTANKPFKSLSEAEISEALKKLLGTVALVN